MRLDRLLSALALGMSALALATGPSLAIASRPADVVKLLPGLPG